MASRRLVNLPVIVTPGNAISAERLQGGRFPHMSKLDSRVWEHYLRGDHPHFADLEYDVKVGQMDTTPADQEDALGVMWETLIKKRIDVIARTESELWVVEVKPIANMAALGQVLTYAYLYEKQYRPIWPIRRYVICDEIDADVPPIYRAYDVRAVVVDSASPSAPSPVRQV